MRALQLEIINESTLDDWLPRTLEKKGVGVQVSETRCSDFYVPEQGSTEFGLTQIESINLDEPSAAPRGTAVLGAADLVYSSTGTMVVAARPWYALPSRFRKDAGSVESVALNYTNLHSFDLLADVHVPTYVASGRVGGAVNNSFAVDEKGGLLRVATTTQLSASVNSPSGSSVSSLFVLEPKAGVLQVRGSQLGIARGDRITATRFIGNRGYVVTNRSSKPLIVFDFSDPSTPSMIAEVQIKGFSEYMHPLGDTHLITIGRDVAPNGDKLGLALQIFDVTDGANPRSTFRFVYPPGGASEASYDHHAFTFFAEQGLLAFPYVGKESGANKSTLEVFRVGIENGFEKLGSIDHTSLLAAQSSNGCFGFYGPEVRRGLFLDTVAYSISSGGVIAADIRSLDTPIASVAFDIAKFDTGKVDPPDASAPSEPDEPGDAGAPRDGGASVPPKSEAPSTGCYEPPPKVDGDDAGKPETSDGGKPDGDTAPPDPKDASAPDAMPPPLNDH